MGDPTQVEIQLPKDGRYGGKIVVGGHDISNATLAVTVRARPGDISRVEVDLITFDGVIAGEAVVVVPDFTRKALIALGWTPPDGDRG